VALSCEVCCGGAVRCLHVGKLARLVHGAAVTCRATEDVPAGRIHHKVYLRLALFTLQGS
jgi:hypothetical protein